MYDIIIIGMGISGITAGIYAKRSNKNVLIIDKGMPGGLLNSIDMISNYPGLINISGPDFSSQLLKQVEELKIPYSFEEVLSFDLNDEVKKIKTTKNEYSCKKIILAMGRKPKYLGLDKEKDLLGRGVSTCALCDGYFYKNKDIAIVGTGNSALQEALYLSKIVNKIYLINRRDGFRGDEAFVEEVKNNKKIEIVYNANISDMNEEDGKLKSITLSNGQSINVAGVFVYIGYRPATEIVDKNILDENGYIIVDENFETPIKGVYAIGDIINKKVYQLVTAASDGAVVISRMK